jgi:hypothetical protein
LRTRIVSAMSAVAPIRPTVAFATESAFDRATAVTPRPDSSAYDIVIDPSWTAGDKPNGGYLLATLVRASIHSLKLRGAVHTDPLGSTATFLRAPTAGPATVRVEILRAGRSASHVRATLSQNDTFCVDAVSVIGELEDRSEARFAEPPPELPPIDECPRLLADREASPIRVNVLDVTDVRLHPADMAHLEGASGGSPDLRGWMAFPDGRQADPLALLFALDCFPPATMAIGSTGWVPTLQLSAYVHARPSEGPLRIRQRATSVQAGLVDEICQVWDSTNRLVAQGTQLAQVRFAPTD